MINEPRTYRVINKHMLETLARSMGTPIGTETKSETEMGLTKIVTARRKQTRSTPPLTGGDPSLIPLVVEGLRHAGLLHIERPKHPNEYWHGNTAGYYVWEEAILTPVHLPLRERVTAPPNTPEALNIWIGDPPPRLPGAPEWDFATCFLFLIEELGDFEWPDRSFISGISSLRLIAEFIGRGHSTNAAAVEAMRSSEDRFGRFNSAHPIEKLRAIGGVVGTPRRVETVYKVGYVTDEQAYLVNDSPCRVGDLLAYPLYVA